MKKVILAACALLFFVGAEAQDFVDNALLFSRPMPSGSARILGIGGAQTALGGDFSSALSNPAGLGMYNRSEFTITPGVTFQRSVSRYNDVSVDESKGGFNIPGLSLVFNHESGKQSGFLGGSFAVTMTRINDFNRNFTFRGTNSENSIVDFFIDESTGFDPNQMLWDGVEPGDQFFTLHGLAYNNYLTEDYIDETDPANPVYRYRSVLTPVREEGETRTVDQQKISESRGAQTQWSFSYGANLSDRFFVGAGLGVSSIRFKVRQKFREENFRYDVYTDWNPVEYFETDETFDITGSGVNVTLGAIYRPVDFLQVGLSYNSPTFYGVTDSYDARIESVWNYYGDPNEPSFPDQRNVSEEFGQPLLYEYNLRTPMRINTGAAFLSKLGFVTADVEFVNYSKARYSTEFSDDLSPENFQIKSAYQSVINYRAGAELRHQSYRVRAGYSYMSDPFRNDNMVTDQSIKSITGGLGYRASAFFIDLGAVFSKTEQRHAPYSVEGPDPFAYQTVWNSIYRITLGFTF